MDSDVAAARRAIHQSNMSIGRRPGVLWILAALLGVGTAGFLGCSSTPASSMPAEAVNATLSASVQQLDPATGAVSINGVDTRRPTKPFLFEWGDGTSSQNFFPASHIYVDLRRNYLIKVTATYVDGSTQSVSVPVAFRDSKAAPPTPPAKSRY
jgi:hypothetical protein